MHMRKLCLISGSVVAAAVLLTAGCGNKTDDTTATTTTTTPSAGSTTTTAPGGAPTSGPAAEVQQKANDPNTSEAGRQYLQGRNPGQSQGR